MVYNKSTIFKSKPTGTKMKLTQHSWH